MGYDAGDVAWLLEEWVQTTAHGGEYMTWRHLVGRYPGKSNLTWLWGLVDAAVADGYLAIGTGSEPAPDPDSRVNWDRWQLTPKGRLLLGQAAPIAPIAPADPA